MTNISRISVIGDGGWGTTLGVSLARKGFPVKLWGVFHDYVVQTRARRENIKFLPGVKIPESVVITSSMEEALSGSELVILASPSQFMRGVLDMVKMQAFKDKVFLSVTKGIENRTLKTMSEVVKEVIGEVNIAVMSGPTIALEVANGAPTTVVVSSKDPALADTLQSVFMTDRFRVYTNDDVIGVELGGSLKNIIAIAAGASDAMGFGTNAKSALLTRGLVEIARLGVAMGARRETFYG